MTYTEAVYLDHLSFHVTISVTPTTLSPRVILHSVNIEGPDGRTPIMHLLSGFTKKALSERAISQHERSQT